MSSFTCPRCRRRITGDDAALGYCGHCRAYTGLCAAGRVLAFPGIFLPVLDPNWRHSCTSRGEVPITIRRAGQETEDALLCQAHTGQVRRGQAPWVTRYAVLADEL
jgi:hypothetical protein